MNVRNARAIGAIVRQRRRELGLDQVELANRIDASRFWVVQMEQGKEGAEIGRVLRALEALDLAVEIHARDAAGKRQKGSEPIQIPVFDIDAIVASAKRAPSAAPATKSSKQPARRRRIK